MADINKEKVAGVIFDYGGTIDSRGDHWSEVIWEAYQKASVKVEKQEFRNAYVYAERELAKVRHILPHHNFYDLLLIKMQIELSYLVENGQFALSEVGQKAEEIAGYCYNAAKSCVEEARPILEQLSAKYPMVLVSNFYGNVEAVLGDFDINKYFIEMVESAVVGVRKPDPEIFRLGVKALLAVAPKKQIFDVLRVFSDLNIEVVDITFNCVGDYYECKIKETDNVLGAVLNIGHDKIDVSIFNKGILIKNRIINLGSRNIDKDISYVYGVDLNSARELKEKFAFCSRRYADINEVLEFSLDDEQKCSINQYEITEIVEARIVELLKLAKKEINNLTKRKISYIIVTGGITELMGFSYVVENILGINSSTLNSTTIGIRNNKFSSAMGIIKYFHEKMNLRGKNVTFFDDVMVEQMLKDKKSMLELTDDTIISKIFGYFSNN